MHTSAITSLYIHVPFCSRKCRYCAFYSLPAPAVADKQQFLVRLADEFDAQADKCGALQSIFIGGGTPSLLEPVEMRQLFQQIRSHFVIAADAEITVENNPASLTAAKIDTYAEVGVSRVSLGIQTFDPNLRALLGRSGDLKRLPETVAQLHAVGLHNINVDLIYAIPTQTLTAWQDDLQRSLEFEPRHLSTYCLTVEEGTVLAGDKHDSVPAEVEVEMWDLSEEIAQMSGMYRYEVSNFAQTGYECRHNLRIWHGARYLGCGPAAASFAGSTRWSNVASWQKWLLSTPPEKDELPPAERAAEILAFGLRTTSGWGRNEFSACTGFDYLELRSAQIAALVGDGLLCCEAERLAPTHRGLLFADEIVTRLL